MGRIRYPTGARPLLIEETARRRRIESRVVALLEGGGFAEVVLPIIDFAEPYAGITGRAAAKQSYRFTDREGELVSIRSDFTPMVARALAPALRENNLPLRVFYRGDVIRCESSRLGANREMFQIGAEIIGDASADADIAMLRLAASIASAFFEEPLVVYALGTPASSPAGQAASRRPDGDETSPDQPPGRRRSAIEAALDGDPRFVLHDDDHEGRGYYTGIRFWVYGTDRRKAIAQGGRYDSLYERFGAKAPAIGFTFTIDDLD
jgi:ATP phosphoribosyltransferase regulatory subunit HisZ